MGLPVESTSICALSTNPFFTFQTKITGDHKGAHHHLQAKMVRVAPYSAVGRCSHPPTQPDMEVDYREAMPC